MRVGVLAMQGAFREHVAMLNRLGADGFEVRTREQLEQAQALVIPGGESTTMGKLLTEFNLLEPLKARAEAGLPVFGTCAGMVLLADEIEGSDQPKLALMRASVLRNAYGRQVDSFEADVPIPALGETPFHCVFIRAPFLRAVRPPAEVLATCDGRIIMARQGRYLATSFHPELTDDVRVHRYFLETVAG